MLPITPNSSWIWITNPAEGMALTFYDPLYTSCNEIKHQDWWSSSALHIIRQECFSYYSLSPCLCTALIHVCFLGCQEIYFFLSIPFLAEKLGIYAFMCIHFNPFSLRMILRKAEEENTMRLNFSKEVYSPSHIVFLQDFQNYLGFPGTLACAENIKNEDN